MQRNVREVGSMGCRKAGGGDVGFESRRGWGALGPPTRVVKC